MSNELQKDEFMIAGGLGYCIIGGKIQGIVESLNGNNGSVTLTISPSSLETPIITEDAEFEIIKPKELLQ